MTQNISFKLFSLHQVGPFLCSYILGISWHRSTSTRHLSTKLNDLWMKGPYVSIVKPISLFITSLDLKLIPLPKIIVLFSRLELIKAETEGSEIVFIEAQRIYKTCASPRSWPCSFILIEWTINFQTIVSGKG